MGKYSPECNVVYLDQKDWIYLARQYYGRYSKKNWEKLLDVVLDASERNSAIFPLSIIHFEETLHRLDKKSRTRLATFMVMVSKGYTIFPATSNFMEMECRNAARKILGLPTIDLCKFVIGKGISHMVGAKGKLVPKPGAQQLPDELKKQILEYVETPEVVLKLLKIQKLAENASALKLAHFEKVRKMEQIRKMNLRISDKNLRYRTCLVEWFTSTTWPWLYEMLLEQNLPKDAIINEKWSKQDFQDFFESMPSLFCTFELCHRRDQLIQRPIDVNDINDIWGLSMAIPYCDIVITESMWRSIASQSKLDEEYETLVFSSAEELIDIL